MSQLYVIVFMPFLFLRKTLKLKKIFTPFAFHIKNWLEEQVKFYFLLNKKETNHPLERWLSIRLSLSLWRRQVLKIPTWRVQSGLCSSESFTTNLGRVYFSLFCFSLYEQGLWIGESLPFIDFWKKVTAIISLNIAFLLCSGGMIRFNTEKS